MTSKQSSILAVILGVIGYGMLILFGGWKIAVGVFFINYAINVEQSKIRRGLISKVIDLGDITISGTTIK